MQYKDLQDGILSDRKDRKARGRERDYNMIFKKSKDPYRENDTQKHCGGQS